MKDEMKILQGGDMTKHFKILGSISGLCFLLFCVSLPLSAQVRGRALYEKLTRDRGELVKYEGLERVEWTPDGTAFYQFEKDSFVVIDAVTGQKKPLFDDPAIIEAYNALTGKSEDKLPFRRFTYLDNGKKIRFMVGSRAFIYDLATGKILFYVPERDITGVRGRIYSEVFSPDFKYRAFIRDYNLYIQDLEGNERALTADGHKDLRNGFPDWVYPEELSQYEAFWWSPDSKRIAFMQFDESPVSKYPIVHDISPRPELELQSYPKAGDNNPIVRFFIVDIGSKKITRIETGMETNVYLFRGQWTHDGKEFTYQRLNRLQNVLELFAADPETGKVRKILRDEDPCYIEADFDLQFLGDNRHFLWTSEKSGWNQIYLYDLQGSMVRQLTDKQIPVTGILEVDEENGWVYFSGAENRGMESYVYRVRMDGTGFTRLTDETGGHRASFSPGGKYFTDSFSSWDTPRRLTLHRPDGTLIRELGKSVLTEEFQSLKLIKPEHFTFKSADGKYDLDGILYKPAHFDEKETYPLIMSVYGGPGAKRVYNRFVLNDGNQALAQLGFVVIAIDHRGISGRGKAFQNLMYMNLGQIELEDHVAAAKFVGAFPYVDDNRVGIYGHSYGGYMTCIALLKAPDVFHVGVAGAPVTDWRNYDTIYTERYMRRPQDNPEGYEKGSCMNYAQDLKGHLSIHHGAVDDNVHPGNSVQLLYALQKHNKHFDFMLYPEQRHGIRVRTYGESRVDYFIRHLKPEVK
jgi:dipeptidyl-peptidase-4